MVNHFRTLIINKPFVSETDHIARNYAAAGRPAALKAFGDILIPPTESDYLKLHRMYNFERAIQAAGLEDFEKVFDTRVTYLLDELTDNFSYAKLSPVVPANADSSNVSVTATPITPLQVDELNLTITQLSNSNTVDVYRVLPLTHATQRILSNTPIVWSGTNLGASSAVIVPVYNVSLLFSTSISFISTSNKTWTVTLNGHSTFELLTLIDNLKNMHQHVVRNMLAYKSKYSTATFDLMWEKHDNKVYQFAGLLLGYFYRLQTALES